MTLTRRTFIGSAAAMTCLGSVARAAQYAPTPSGWRTFVLTTRIALPRQGAAAEAWVPVPYHADETWARPGATTFQTTGEATLLRDDAQRIAFVHARWDAGETPAALEVVSRASVQDRRVDLTGSGAAELSDAERARHLAATDFIPTNGLVLDTARAITGDADDDLTKARRIYDWVVEQTERNPETRGCGLGDVASMLATGDLTGKCADLNALYVGLARAAGLPARDLYGLRVAPSAFGYKALGAGSETVTKAQHCRAEVFIDGAGWVPVDPADVRKVVLEEPPKTLTLADPEVAAVRTGLFGSAEGNWLCYNTAHDVTLPGLTGTLPFFMYPQAVIDGVPQDELDPATFTYEISVAAG